LTVLVPAFPDDAKGLTIAALRQDSPVVIIEHRALYGIEGEVREAYEATPIGKARRVREGRHITIVGTSLMVQEALHAADELARHEVEAEVIDLRSVHSLDEETVDRKDGTSHRSRYELGAVRRCERDRSSRCREGIFTSQGAPCGSRWPIALRPLLQSSSKRFTVGSA
jgi:transketolase